MCGIAAMFAYHNAAPAVDHEELRRIRDFMLSRGPDGCGEWHSTDGKTGLAHRRLSIIDLSPGGAQPMESARVVVSFNGEIYNYRELRAGLERKGRVFRSSSDTEVLLHLYEEKGERMVHDLRGMFAFALWDGVKQKLMLVRDPYGIKPLYYADDGRTVRAASQVKALLESRAVSRSKEPAGTVGFFLLGSVPEPYTLYRDIRQVPAGCFMTVTRAGCSEPERYFSIGATFAQRPADPGDAHAIKTAREALLDSVRHHLVSDVPIGLFLSAGIDSTAVLAFVAEEGRRLQAITLAYPEYAGTPDDESPLAQATAEHYGAPHVRRLLTRDEFRAELPRVLEKMDQPSIDGINTYFVCKAAREAGLKVVLSGLGADELFGGYPSFREVPMSVRWLRGISAVPFAGDAFYFAARPLSPKAKHAGLLKYGGTYAGAYFLKRGLFMPWELKALIPDEAFVQEGLSRLDLFGRLQRDIEPDPDSGFARVAALESSWYLRNQLLRDADWAGMAHSIEIRTPYVDSVLLQKMAPLLSRAGLTKKKWLSGSLEKPLPPAILGRAKTGFTVPIMAWTEEEDSAASWRAIPMLAKKGCPWARRWAYRVYREAVNG